MEEKRYIKQEKGITLIALIITIIVMLILVAVTIQVTISGGIFSKAGEATKGYKEGELKERIEIAKAVAMANGGGKLYKDALAEALIKDGIINDVETDIVEKGEGNFEITTKDGSKFEIELEERAVPGVIAYKNLQYSDGQGGTAIIPKGFTVSGAKDEQIVKNGLVIYLIPEEEITSVDWTNEEGILEAQQSYDQYVWIPVNYTASGETEEHDLDTGFLKLFHRNEWTVFGKNDQGLTFSEVYKEPYEVSEYEEEKIEYYAMMKSVQDNYGFYIGRYEAGSTELRTNSSTDTNLVVRRDQYPYNNVAWGLSMTDVNSEVTTSSVNHGHGAVYLSRHMYNGEELGVEPTLIYGVQWDAVLNFVKDSTHNVTNSSNWGNYLNNNYKIGDGAKCCVWTSATTSSPQYVNGPLDVIARSDYQEGNMLTTGASDEFRVKNLYDIAGNMAEWTMEYRVDTISRSPVGGDGLSNGGEAGASYRSYTNVYGLGAQIGFRPALYIKNN